MSEYHELLKRKHQLEREIDDTEIRQEELKKELEEVDVKIEKYK